MKWSQAASAYARNAAMSYSVNQLSGRVAGLDTSFSWRSVASTVVGATVGNAAGHGLGLDGGNLWSGVARSVVTGSSQSYFNQQWARGGKLDFVQLAMDSFGNALGNDIVGKMITKASANAYMAAKEKYRYGLASLHGGGFVNPDLSNVTLQETVVTAEPLSAWENLKYFVEDFVENAGNTLGEWFGGSDGVIPYEQRIQFSYPIVDKALSPVTTATSLVYNGFAYTANVALNTPGALTGVLTNQGSLSAGNYEFIRVSQAAPAGFGVLIGAPARLSYAAQMSRAMAPSGVVPNSRHIQTRTGYDVNAIAEAWGNLPPWRADATVVTELVPPGTRYQMVVSEGQAKALLRGKPAFGGFATTENVTSQVFARDSLVILDQFKTDVSRVVTVETTGWQKINRGITGPLENYRGGVEQVQFLNGRDLKLVDFPRTLPLE